MAGREDYTWGETLTQEWNSAARRVTFTTPLVIARQVVLEGINSIFFELRLWKRNDESGKGGELVAEAEFEAVLTLASQTTVVLTEPLRYRGKLVGRVLVTLLIAQQRFFQQKSSGVLVDGEYRAARPLFDSIGSDANPELAAIATHLKRLNELFRIYEDTPRWDSARESLQSQILPCYASLEEICLKVHSRTRNAFRYKTQAQLEEGQKLFLAVLGELIGRARRVEPFEDRQFYRILLVCFDRGELQREHLRQIGGEPLRRYDQLFGACLFKALEEVAAPVSSEANNFALRLLARAYFRSERFRRQLLSKLPSVERPPNAEPFEWTAVLPSEALSDSEESAEEMLLQAKLATARLLKDAFFLSFFREWIEVAHREYDHENWANIGGFAQLVAHFIARFLVNLPSDEQPVIDISARLASDAPLFLRFTKAVQDNYERDNARRVEFTFKLFNRWCAALRDARMSLPLRFKSYWVTAQLELHSADDRAFPLFEVLSFIYKNFDIFSVHTKAVFLRRIVVRHFDLAVHWNEHIRKIVVLLFSFRFLHFFETNRVECALEVTAMLRRMLVLQQAGKAHAEALVNWERRSRAERRRFPLQKVEALVIAQLEPAVATLANSPFARLCALGAAGEPLDFPALRPSQLAYCQTAYSHFLSSFEAYLRSEYRCSGDETQLFSLVYVGGHDKSEFREQN